MRACKLAVVMAFFSLCQLPYFSIINAEPIEDSPSQYEQYNEYDARGGLAEEGGGSDTYFEENNSEQNMQQEAPEPLMEGTAPEQEYENQQNATPVDESGGIYYEDQNSAQFEQQDTPEGVIEEGNQHGDLPEETSANAYDEDPNPPQYEQQEQDEIIPAEDVPAVDNGDQQIEN